MILEPLPDTRHTRRNLPHLIAAAGHLRVVDQLARELMPCEHLPIIPPTGESVTSVDDLNVAVHHLGSALRFTVGCTCRHGANSQLRSAYEIAVTLWDYAYAEAVFRAHHSGRRARRSLPQHTERLRRHRARFEQLADEHRAMLELDDAWTREVAEQTRRDAEQVAAGYKPVACWVCDGGFYAPHDDAGDRRGRYNCGSVNCASAY